MAEPLQMLRSVVDQDRARLEEVVVRDSLGETGSLVRVRRGVSAIFRSWDELIDAMTSGAAGVAGVWGDTRLTVAARADEVAERVAALRQVAEAALDVAQGRADELVELLRREFVPQRPQPADAAQEAAIANLKADLAMVLDPLPLNEIAPALVEELKDAQFEGDALRVWLLGGSDWPTRYLRSRGADEYAARFHQDVAAVTTSADNSDDVRRRKRQVLEMLESRHGLRGALVGMRAFVAMKLDEIAEARAET